MGLELVVGGEGAVEARRLEPRCRGAGELGVGHLVAGVLLEHGRGELVLAQHLDVGPLVELAGHRIEEGLHLGDLFVEHLLRRRLDAELRQ